MMERYTTENFNGDNYYLIDEQTKAYSYYRRTSVPDGIEVILLYVPPKADDRNLIDGVMKQHGY